MIGRKRKRGKMSGGCDCSLLEMVSQNCVAAVEVSVDRLLQSEAEESWMLACLLRCICSVNVEFRYAGRGQMDFLSVILSISMVLGTHTYM